MHKISTATGRAALPLRREPYWHPIAPGRALGFRKLSESTGGSWIARFTIRGTEHRKSLPDVLAHPDAQRFGVASQLAQAWFASMGALGPSKAVTMRAVCENYLTHLRATKGAKTADIEERRFQRLVYGHPWLANAHAAELTAADFDRWRQSISVRRTDARNTKGEPLSPATIARDLAPIRAALNRAYELDVIASNKPWLKTLEAPKEQQDKRIARAYLTPKDRRALLDHLEHEDARAFFEVLSVLPLRPGALAAMHVEHYTPALRQIVIAKDKQHAGRSVVLPPAIDAIFARAAKGKTHGEFLFGRADGRAWTAETWRGPFRLAAAAAGLSRKASAYSLRHSTITDLLTTGGLDMNSVAVLAGTSAVMISKHYFHLVGTGTTAALAKMAQEAGHE